MHRRKQRGQQHDRRRNDRRAPPGCSGENTGRTNTPGGEPPPAPPQAVVTASPLTPKVGESVSLRAAQAQPSDTATWMFGDGAQGSGAQTTHTYATPGQSIVHLTPHRGDK